MTHPPEVSVTAHVLGSYEAGDTGLNVTNSKVYSSL